MGSSRTASPLIVGMTAGVIAALTIVGVVAITSQLFQPSIEARP